MKWVEKYAPNKLGDVLGNAKIKAEIEVWANKWVRGEVQPPLLLVGPPGVGKTTMAHLVGKEYFSETIEVNASDKRSYDIIKRSVGESAQTRSLFQSGYKLIIIDEVDGITGRDDKGGSKAINEVIKEAKQPIILMANDPYSKKLSTIKNKCTVLKFTKIKSPSINAQLKRICQKEAIEFEPEALLHLSKESNGDLRSAITALQAIVDDDKIITEEDVKVITKKDVQQNVFDTIRTILKSQNMEHIKEAMRVDAQPQFLIELIAENIPREYEKPHEIAKAYEMISLADINLGQAFRTQNYTYWKYAFLFMGRGVADAKDTKYKKFVPYKNSTVYGKMSKSRKQKNLTEDVTHKMGEKLHTSPKQLVSHLPYFTEMFQDNEHAYDLKEYFKLTDDEVKLFRSRKIPASVGKNREKILKKQQKEEEKRIEEEKKQKAKEAKKSEKEEDKIDKSSKKQPENLFDIVSPDDIKKAKIVVEKSDEEIKEEVIEDKCEDKTIEVKKVEKKDEDKPKTKQMTLFDF